MVVRCEGQIVSSAWASYKRILVEYLEREISLGQDEVYAYDVFTAPPFRGKNISPVRSAWMLQHFREAGYKRVIGFIVPENESSLRTSRKVGYRPFAVMGYIKLGPFRRDFLHYLDSDQRKLSVSPMNMKHVEPPKS
jgi:RimJ/RimL family protein N-acetyltransferase